MLYINKINKRFNGICLVLSEESATLQRGICTAGYFQCENDTLCVKQGKNCDGIPDCPNHSDEANCGKFKS